MFATGAPELRDATPRLATRVNAAALEDEACDAQEHADKGRCPARRGPVFRLDGVETDPTDFGSGSNRTVRLCVLFLPSQWTARERADEPYDVSRARSLPTEVSVRGDPAHGAAVTEGKIDLGNRTNLSLECEQIVDQIIRQG